MKIAFLYIFLIGMLFIALLGVLQIGKKLKAPVDVSGVWYFNFDSTTVSNNSCSSLGFSPESPEATIQQSGVYLTLLVNNPDKIELRGKIESLNLTLTEDSRNANKCNSVLQANISHTNNNQDELKGILYSPGCKDCPEVRFIATRSIIKK